MSLRVVAPIPAPACPGCTRRTVLQGLATTAASALLGCTSDGAMPPPDAGPGAIATMCGNNLCMDLTDPRNMALTQVDGSVIVAAPNDRIILVRSTATTVLGLSDSCTHAGCPVRYDRNGKVFDCSCHGSQFSLNGAVRRGPATSALRSYTTELDTATNLLTITL